MPGTELVYFSRSRQRLIRNLSTLKSERMHEKTQPMCVDMDKARMNHSDTGINMSPGWGASQLELPITGTSHLVSSHRPRKLLHTLEKFLLAGSKARLTTSVTVRVCRSLRGRWRSGVTRWGLTFLCH